MGTVEETASIDVRHVASLARLELSEEDAAEFGRQMREIVGFVRKIGELDLAGIEPTSHAHLESNVFREDVMEPGLEREAALANAPAQADGQFAAPKIVE